MSQFTDESWSNSVNSTESTESTVSSQIVNKENSDNQLIMCLKNYGCIVEGEFKLKNGEISNVYYDIKSIISHPVLFREICHRLINKLPVSLINYSLIFGIPYGGLPIASYISITNNKPLIYTRNKKKEYGTKKLVEGKYRAGQKVIIIDDVITTGGSIKEAILLARDTLKLRVIACLVVVNRKNIEVIEGVPIYSVINSYT